ncbi:MAG: 16S rRNA (uracil(1498)-N(3))-methyltransferase [Bacteroidales bacterium]|jgi:16S rRNA (uracil1498-N3)-methyltransferase|nr:16S rRNA (uracil(1498)-N(3))-methyltransferase [Bacteroidales bacterium]
MQLFYAPELVGDQYTLDEQESKHVIRVLRKRNGDTIELTDGKGKFYTGELTSDDPRRCELRIIDISEGAGKRNYHLNIAIAPTKNINRFEWFLEKATEIGIDEISPMICQRSERKAIKAERLNKVITAAMKQSLKAYHPALHGAKSFTDLISMDLAGQKFIAYVEEGEHPLLQTLYTPGEDAIILIGPEGDFSPEEVAQAKEKGFKTVSLGESRLRTETAGVVAVHTVAMLNNE